MGSLTTPIYGNVRCLGFCAALLCFVASSPLVMATGEAILLPGYVRQNNPPPAIGFQASPTILPGWAAANPGFVLMPNPSGLKLIVDNTWPDLPGYRMIRLEFLANQPATEERRLRVQLKFQNNNYYRSELTVLSDEIILPAGQTAVKHQLYYPNTSQQHIREIMTTEDGEQWPDLSCNIYTSQQNRNVVPYLDLTLLDSSASLGQLNVQGSLGTRVIADGSSQGTTEEYRNNTVRSYPVNQGWTGLANYAELPHSPLGYDCFQIVICRVSQLTELQTKHPRQWQALQGWLATGGTLLVFPKNNNQADADAISAIEAQLDEQFPLGKAEKNNSLNAAWNKQSISTIPEPLQRPSQNTYYDDDVYQPAQPPSNPPFTGGIARGSSVNYPQRAWFQGTLAVVPNQQHFETVYSHLQNASQNPLPSTPLPLVGLPPITMFQILITLFVILIGPVNYFYFKKKKQLNWLLITVPAGALAITGLLLAYTLMKDGIGVRSWSQSFTILDQVQQQAATRQQFCLFAGITPGDGLRFRHQTNFDDLSEDRSNTYNYRYRDTRSWDFAWDQPSTDSSKLPEQHLRSGWLMARTLKVLETCDFDACQRLLEIQTTGENCELANKLGTKVLAVYIADGDQVWKASEIAADGSGTAKLLNQAQTQNLQTNLEQELFATGNVFDANNRRTLPPQDRTIQDQFLGSKRLSSRVYLAIVERWPELQSGVANPTLEPWGPHVILGVW
jgi:hypothetical protein